MSNETHSVDEKHSCHFLPVVANLTTMWVICGEEAVEGLFTAFNEGAALAAANQRRSKFLNVIQRLHQTTRTADRSHGDPWLLPDTRDKGLVQTPSPFWETSQDPILFFSSTFTKLLIHSGMSHQRPLTVPS